jgi:hypothetical protein
MRSLLISKEMYLKSALPSLLLSNPSYARRASYAQFVFISKEIGTLENELMELKESLSEWKSMPSVLHIEESASVAGLFSHLPLILELTYLRPQTQCPLLRR